jgi:hypothetical protein
MKRRLCAALLFAAISGAAPAGAAVIDFDGLPYTTPTAVVPLSDQYASLGVLFEGGVGSINTFGNVIVLPSDPDGFNVGYMRLDQVQTIRFVDPTNSAVDAVTNFVSFDNLGLIASGGVYDGFTAQAFDLNGLLLGQATINAIGPFAGRSPFQTSFSFEGIHRIVATQIEAGGMAPIDNLTFGPLTTAQAGAVPEPATWLTMIVGFAAVGVMVRRRVARQTAA